MVDDGSTDGTAAFVREPIGARVRYVLQENQREGAARNAGARRASGRYFAFLDSDDYWLPGKLRRRPGAVFASPTHRPALVYSRARNVDPADRPIGERASWPSPQGDVFWSLARESFMPMSTVTVRADAFRACGGFVEDRDLSGTADWELWMRLAARWPVGFVDQIATCIRVHPRNMSERPTLDGAGACRGRALRPGRWPVAIALAGASPGAGHPRLYVCDDRPERLRQRPAGRAPAAGWSRAVRDWPPQVLRRALLRRASRGPWPDARRSQQAATAAARMNRCCSPATCSCPRTWAGIAIRTRRCVDWATGVTP